MTQVPEAIRHKADEMIEVLQEWALKLIIVETGAFKKEMPAEKKKEFEELLLCSKRAITATAVNSVSMSRNSVPGSIDLDDLMHMTNRVFAMTLVHCSKFGDNCLSYIEEGKTEYICPHDDILKSVDEMVESAYKEKEKEVNGASRSNTNSDDAGSGKA